jgi:predicted transcriptional regulator
VRGEGGRLVDKNDRRRKIIYRIGDITERECQNCQFHSGNHNNYCHTHCDFGKELLKLGNLLDPHKGKERKPEPKEEIEVAKGPKLTKAMYDGFMAQGMTMADIARKMDLTDATVHYYKKKFYGEPKPQVKNIEVKPVKENKANEDYKNLLADFKLQLTEKDKRITELEELVQKMADEQENLTAAAEDVENELEEYKMALDTTQKELQGYMQLFHQPKDTSEQEHRIALENVLRFYLAK